MIHVCKDFIKDGDTVLEIGTGWSHWLAIVLRLFYDVRITLFDVRDNRQFDALKQYMRDLHFQIHTFNVSPQQLERADELLCCIRMTKSIEELYELLGFTYTMDIDNIPDNSFNLTISNNVLEHVHVDIAPKLTKDIYRLLKPEGHTFNQFDLTDHISKYDPKAHKKNYLRFSDRQWALIGNDVQYINRIQADEWFDLFEDAGLRAMEFDRILNIPINGLPIAPRFAQTNRQDLGVGYLVMTHRKPPIS